MVEEPAVTEEQETLMTSGGWAKYAGTELSWWERVVDFSTEGKIAQTIHWSNIHNCYEIGQAPDYQLRRADTMNPERLKEISKDDQTATLAEAAAVADSWKGNKPAWPPGGTVTEGGGGAPG